ncbi:MAG TPA: alpha/beta fold hydrolase [Pseudonocardiaceae bacterium]|nr:alpha/beta fold hydrolase [Pseudonocardiaceae bacterium]
MIEINERFTVAAPPDQVYAVLSDPSAVVDCVEGAALGDSKDDGTFDVSITVKFGALRVRFAGKVGLELDPAELRGTVNARGKDGQGGTRFQATAAFQIEPADEGATSVVTATGEVVLSGKLASIIENAAITVVRRMTADFVQALAVRCASGAAELGSSTASAELSVGVLLLHGFAGSPNTLRPWGEALAAANLAVAIPRLPGHGTRWRDLNRTTWQDWYAAAEQAFAELAGKYDRVHVMGLSLGATLALRLAETRDVAGVVAVNPVLTAVAGTPRWPGLARLVRRSARAVSGDVRKAGVTDVGYPRVPLRAAVSLRRFGDLVRAELGRVHGPVLLVTSAVDHVVPVADGDAVWAGLAGADRERLVVEDSFHVVPLDNDAPRLFEASVAFVRSLVSPS